MLRHISQSQWVGLNSSLQDPIEYRKSGLSLNHVIGCPLDCAYCVRHLFNNFEMKEPALLMSDNEAVGLLIGHKFFRRDITPIQIFNRATDPFLPTVKPHLFAVLNAMDAMQLKNHVLVISRYKVLAEDCMRLNALRSLRITLLITHSGIQDGRIEPIDSSIAEHSLKLAYSQAERFRVVQYWRPIVPGLNDRDEDITKAVDLSRHSHATVFTGLFYRDEIKAFYQQAGLPEPYGATARRKILPEDLERQIIATFTTAGERHKLFRKTSCGVCFAHGDADYNGHFGITELCDICPRGQVDLCSHRHRRPDDSAVSLLLKAIGRTDKSFSITDRAIEFDDLDEQYRYFLQHNLRFQVHDRKHPHKIGRHGRADIGWNDNGSI